MLYQWGMFFMVLEKRKAVGLISIGTPTIKSVEKIRIKILIIWRNHPTIPLKKNCLAWCSFCCCTHQLYMFLYGFIWLWLSVLVDIFICTEKATPIPHGVWRKCHGTGNITWAKTKICIGASPLICGIKYLKPTSEEVSMKKYSYWLVLSLLLTMLYLILFSELP